METLTENVLVLNRLWQAVNICTVKKALCLLYQDRAQVVFEDNGDFNTFTFTDWCDFSTIGMDGEQYIHTPRFNILVPKIILLIVYDKTPYKEVKLTRHNIFERDKSICQYCGKKFDRKDLNLDHIVPRDQGGKSSWVNIVCSCKWCNSRKANKTPRQVGLKLIRKPKKPMWRPFLAHNFANMPCDAWRHFIDIAYWNVELGDKEEKVEEEHFDKFVFPR